MPEEMILIRKKILTDLVDLWNVKHHKKHGSPGHSHQIPGIWDSDNSEKIANKPCAECAIYDEARRLVEEKPVYELQENKWYWVNYSGISEDMEMPAQYKNKCFYSLNFGGIPASRVTVLREVI